MTHGRGCREIHRGCLPRQHICKHVKTAFLSIMKQVSIPQFCGSKNRFRNDSLLPSSYDLNCSIRNLPCIAEIILRERLHPVSSFLQTKLNFAPYSHQADSCLRRTQWSHSGQRIFLSYLFHRLNIKTPARLPAAGRRAGVGLEKENASPFSAGITCRSSGAPAARSCA